MEKERDVRGQHMKEGLGFGGYIFNATQVLVWWYVYVVVLVFIQEGAEAKVWHVIIVSRGLISYCAHDPKQVIPENHIDSPSGLKLLLGNARSLNHKDPCTAMILFWMSMPPWPVPLRPDETVGEGFHSHIAPQVLGSSSSQGLIGGERDSLVIVRGAILLTSCSVQ